MALPTYTDTQLSLVLDYIHENDLLVPGYPLSITVGASGPNLSGYTTLVNPYDLGFNFSEAHTPESGAYYNISDRRQHPVDLILTGQTWAAYSDTVRSDIHGLTFLRQFQWAADSPYRYLRILLRDSGGAQQAYRRYFDILDFTMPAYQKTGLRAFQPFQIRLRPTDPYWYGHTINNKTIAVVAGSGTTGNFVPVGNQDTRRVVFTITRDLADVGSVTITTTKAAFTITGTLTAGKKWVVDCYDGRVYEGTGAPYTDAISKFTGSFPPIRGDGNNESITVSEAGATFTVTCDYLGRYM